MEKRNLIFKIIMNILIFFLIAPLIILAIWSFSKIWPWPDLFPKSFGIRGFKYIFNPSNKSLKILMFSVWLSTVVTVITLLISIPAAKALGVYNFKGKRVFKILVLAPIIVPPVVLVHLIPCIPYGVRILTNVFEILGESMEIQARVLGANPFQAFIHITLPLLAPGLLSAGSMVFIVSFSQYFLTFLIGGGKIVTFSMLMFPFIKSGDRMMASVYSSIFILTTLTVLLVMEKMVKSYYKGENYFYL